MKNTASRYADSMELSPEVLIRRMLESIRQSWLRTCSG